MPNWCGNALNISGPSTDVESFVEAITTSEGEHDLTLPHPIPDILLGTTAPPSTHERVEELKAKREAGGCQARPDHSGPLTESGSWVTDEYLAEQHANVDQGLQAFAETGYHDWYDWCVRNWGTKWPPDVHTLAAEDGFIRMVFDTAWAPPDELVLKLSEKFPTLTFILDYSEPGMDFYGAFAFVAGHIAYEMEGMYGDDPILQALQVKIDALYSLDEEGEGLTPKQWATESDLQSKIQDRIGDLCATVSAAAQMALA
jgi:hypothetical protein